MLVTSRKTNERILIGDNIVITIYQIGPHSVRVGIEAPEDVKILRAELLAEQATDRTTSGDNVQLCIAAELLTEQVTDRTG